MKGFFLFFIFAFWTLEVGAVGVLIPSLEVQMKKQEAINTVNRLEVKKEQNKKKLYDLKTKRQSGMVRINSKKTVTPSPNTPLSIKKMGQTPSTQSIPPNQSSLSDIPIQGVDMEKVRTVWNRWYTEVRSGLSLSGYTYDTRLDSTARDWNTVFAQSQGQNHHRRHPSDSYYDYTKVTEWFRVRGVVGKVINGATTTENVGYGYYSCSQSDCTDELIQSIRSTFDFFMSEKGKAYDAHYRSIVQPSFTKIGLAILVAPSEKQYYLTVHYITDFQE